MKKKDVILMGILLGAILVVFLLAVELISPKENLLLERRPNPVVSPEPAETNRFLVTNGLSEGGLPGNEEVYVLTDKVTDCEFIIFRDVEHQTTTIRPLYSSCGVGP